MEFQILENAPREILPLEELGDYLLLQAGATGEVRQDAQLELALRSAILEIETYSGRVILQKQYAAEGSFSYKAPLPFSNKEEVAMISASHAGIAIDPSTFEIRVENECVLLVSGASYREFRAVLAVGANAWQGVQSDLQLAVIALAAHYYTERFDGDQTRPTPIIVRNILEKYRKIRVG